MRVSDYFKLNKTQPYLDFVDVTLDTDVPAFVDPSAIKSLQSDWGHQCTSLLQRYFEGVLRCILDGNDDDARGYLSCLNERNEFHLGFSRGESRGHAFGAKSADSVWCALSRSRAAKSGLLEDLEDTALLIEGVGKDMISDAVCNIIRGPLIEYTQIMCHEYGIPLTPDVPSGSVWDSTSRTFSSFYTELPVTNKGPVILVPKILVRYDISYRYDEYYAHYLLPEMQRDEIARSSSLVHLLKNGKRRVTKKSLRERYGSSKSSVAEQTVRFPDVLNRYRTDKKAKTPVPLTHLDLVMIGGAAIPDYDGLIARLKDIPVGRGDESPRVSWRLVVLSHCVVTV